MLSRLWRAWCLWLAWPVDGGSLAVVRMVVGLIIALTALELVWPQGGSSLLRELYTADHIQWHAKYTGFSWVPVLSEPAMNAVCWLLAGSGGLVLLGWFYRPAVIVATMLRGYLFLCDAAYFNNHYYLECVLLALLCCMPAARRYSIDAWFRRRAGLGVEHSIAFWPIALIRLQLVIVYFYGGVTKINEFYLWHAYPLRSVFQDPNLGQSLSGVLSEAWLSTLRGWLARPEVAFAFAYAGILFDLTIGFLLLWRRTRHWGIVLAVMFHGLNHFVLFQDIGWFPLLGVGTLAIFLEPDWPSRAARRLRHRTLRLQEEAPARPTTAWKPLPAFSAALICGWLLVQLMLPLRHWAIAGDVNWTDESSLLSWRMKAHHKLSRPTVFRIEVDELVTRDNTGRTRVIWDNWPQEKWLLQDVDAARVSWRRMPTFFVEFLPLYGERIVFNPQGRDRAELLDVATSVEYVQTAWRRHFGRPLKVSQIHATESLDKVFEFWHAHLLQDAAGPTEIAAIRECRQHAIVLDQHRHDPSIVATHLRQLHAALITLLFDPKRGGQFRNLLSRLSPFALSGAAPPVDPCYFLEDGLLQAEAVDGYSTLRRDVDIGSDLAAQEVFADIETFTNWEWNAMPRFLVVRTKAGDEQVRWNPYQEMNLVQEHLMRIQPAMIYEYAHHIAGQWNSTFGQWPRVYADTKVALLPWAMQPLIDPEVDLAAVQRHLLRHNDWIVPLQKHLPMATDVASGGVVAPEGR